MTSKIKLNVGSTYRNGLGKEVTIISKSNQLSNYPYEGSDLCKYRKDGVYCEDMDCLKVLDLVEEVLK